MKERTKDLIVMLIVFACGFALASVLPGCWTEHAADGSATTSVLGVPVSSTTAEGVTTMEPGFISGLPWWGQALAYWITGTLGAGIVTNRGKLAANLKNIANPKSSWLGTLVQSPAAILLGTGTPAEAKTA